MKDCHLLEWQQKNEMLKIKKKLKNKRNKSEWIDMNVLELSHRLAHRYGRIEVIKDEIEVLRDLIESKRKYNINLERNSYGRKEEIQERRWSKWEKT